MGAHVVGVLGRRLPPDGPSPNSTRTAPGRVSASSGGMNLVSSCTVMDS